MDKFLIIFGAILGIFVGGLLIICGVYNTVMEITRGHWVALVWMIAAVFGVWFVLLSFDEIKKARRE